MKKAFIIVAALAVLVLLVFTFSISSMVQDKFEYIDQLEENQKNYIPSTASDSLQPDSTRYQHSD